MRHLITGGDGFIASHLASKLPGEVWALTKEDLDITNLEEVERVMRDFKPDHIYHLAAAATQGGHKGGREIFDVNVVGTYNLLEASNDIKYESFINVGSSSEYGSKKTKPMKEDDIPEPEFAYSGSKVAATMLCRAWAYENKKPIVTIRPFSVYGPGESDKRFIPTVINSAITGKTMNLAPGVHDWTHVDDLANNILAIAKQAEDLSGEVVNLGTGVQMTNDEVVKIISMAMEKAIHTEEITLMRSWDGTQVWVNDPAKTIKLGLKFRTFGEGISDTIAYYESKTTKS